ncbi:MAG: mismatch repair protein MutT [Bacteroidota bacterium]|nr:mismatch repair protein MutT [Bacteroidota bacterium]
MSISLRILFIGIIVVLIDLYFYQAIRTIMIGSSITRKNIVFYIYWSFTFFSFLLFLSPTFFSFADFPKFVRVYLFAFVFMVLLSKIIGSVFLAVDDIIRLFRWIGSYFFAKSPEISITGETVQSPHAISRLKFLNYVAVGMAALPFASFLYGMVKGAFDYKIHRVKVVLPNLPSSFNGLKIVQISDIHSGSFVSASPLEEAVKLINEQNADIVFFTGDLVNDRAVEVEPLMNTLAKITAPMGVFSTLGNHDYGDYATWDSAEHKRANLEDLKKKHHEMGWKLMMNEHVALQRGEDKIALIGIENWGGKMGFPKYGDMEKAYAGAENYPVKLLLSHDPSHWDKQVRAEYPDVDITFSGHTHGFQFGIEIPGFKWSPSQYVYKEWAGLYTEGKQHIYVNRGLGFLGYPGRVGILPEITVMELFNS